MSFWNICDPSTVNQQKEIYNMQANISNLARIDQYSSKTPLHCHSLQMSCITNQLLTTNVTKSCRAYVDKHGGILIYLLLCVIEYRHWIFIDNSIEYGLMSSPCTFYCSMNSSKKMNGEQLQPACMVFLNQDFCKLGSTPVYT